MSQTCIQTAEYRYGQVTAAGAHARIDSRVHTSGPAEERRRCSLPINKLLPANYHFRWKVLTRPSRSRRRPPDTTLPRRGKRRRRSTWRARTSSCSRHFGQLASPSFALSLFLPHSAISAPSSPFLVIQFKFALREISKRIDWLRSQCHKGKPAAHRDTLRLWPN